MSDTITTLKKKGDSSVNIYPNIKRDNIPNGGVSTSKIEDLAVTTAKINDLAVTTAKIQNQAVETSKIKDSAVTSDKMADSSVTSNKIANNSVTASKIPDNTIPLTKFTGKKFLQHYRLDLGDLDLSSYGVSGGSVTFQYKSNTSNQISLNDLFEDLLSSNFNYILSGYFISNNIYYNIIEFSIKFQNNDYYVSLFGVSSSGLKRVDILASDIYGVVTDYSYEYNI